MKRENLFICFVIISIIFLSGCTKETYFVYLGNREGRQGNYDSAIKYYDKALNINPYNAEIYFNRGLVWDYKKNLNNAISDYTKAIEIKKDFKDAYHNRGLIYNRKKIYELAISDFTKASQLNPDNLQKFQLIFNRGYSWSEMDYYEKAIDDYNEAIKIHEMSKLNPSDLPEVYYYRAEAWYGKGNLDNAISDYTRAIEKNPSYVKAIFHRADRLHEKRDYASASIDYEKAIELNLKDPVLYNNYSWLLSTCPDGKFRNGEKALKLALKANELKPNEIIFLNTLAAAYAENKDFEKAVQIQTNSISLIKDNKENLKNLKDNLKTELIFFKAGKPLREDIKYEGWMKNYKLD